MQNQEQKLAPAISILNFQTFACEIKVNFVINSWTEVSIMKQSKKCVDPVNLFRILTLCMLILQGLSILILPFLKSLSLCLKHLLKKHAVANHK